MHHDINSTIYVSDISASDKKAYVEHFKEKQIYDQTLTIPFPYTQADADWWIKHVEDETKQFGQSINWAIREKSGALIGGIGLSQFESNKSHKAEIGYWLAKQYWNQGITSETVSKIVDFAFNEFGLERITASVFDFNAASSRVLEKAGFKFEGLLKHYYLKDGKFFDAKLYAKTTSCDQHEGILIYPIGYVRSTRKNPVDDHWLSEKCSITLDSKRFTPDALLGLNEFSHIEVLFYLGQIRDKDIEWGARHPRNNPQWPKVGVFSQRTKYRPNRIGVTICKIIDVNGLTINVEGLDAIDGTCVLDIKPWVKEFAPHGITQQPAWISELTRNYWR